MKQTIAVFALVLSALPAAAQTIDCSTPEGVKAATGQAEQYFNALRADQNKHQAAVEAELKAKNFSKERSAQLFMNIMASKEFQAFEKEKQPYVMELLGIMQGKAERGSKEECLGIKRIQEITEKVKVVNARQYGNMGMQVKAAK